MSVQIRPSPLLEEQVRLAEETVLKTVGVNSPRRFDSCLFCLSGEFMGPKQLKGKRSKHIYWEYDGDGRFNGERWDKKDKRRWKRWLRHQEKFDLNQRIDEL